ncbi:hypothetical protein [Tuwongella immobilis]|uniref:Uncharacterized protein n=1 Tax=Tuwongella immobilis TaxID=692036 RepID=A0A6C2YIW9_9BACT|nr:hypothetical protein [Tuwongella immobilis]VIP01189.1 Uncharacterized protein OS=Calothrix sp. PCC 6303 GN=Cal6303_5399 PE=4 SV=1 [Tuwongella immobilis]VTR97804.1 Uncharacterized protein OS=Calothrix sp. PCC 6303 GN=Cal6303_5399 PE=4 SV=1 [Tuwongella immobilis]
MSITLSVRELLAHVNWDGPLFVAGRLWLDADGARLFDWDSDACVPLADPVACEAVRAALPPGGEYLGGALMQAWLGAGPQLHTAYWILLGDIQHEPASRWGPRVAVRPVPPQFDFAR